MREHDAWQLLHLRHADVEHGVLQDQPTPVEEAEEALQKRQVGALRRTGDRLTRAPFGFAELPLIGVGDCARAVAGFTNR